VLDHDDAAENPLQVHADEHDDRPVIAAFERIDVGGPEGVAERCLSVGAEGGVVRRRPFLGRKGGGRRKQAFETSFDVLTAALPGDDERHGTHDEQDRDDEYAHPEGLPAAIIRQGEECRG